VTREGDARTRLESLFRAALVAVDPAAAVRRAVQFDGSDLVISGRPVPRDAHVIAFAVGKAAVPMAAELDAIAGSRISAGLVVAPDADEGPSLSTRFSLQRTAHPVPDARSERAGQQAISLVASARPRDVLVAMISGGASSLLSCPAPGITIDELARTTACLLVGGAGIDELNAVRKHLSRVAGGRLAAHVGCNRVEQLVISDVAGDRLDVIGSGPLVGDRSTFADALAVLERRTAHGGVPERVLAHLQAGARGEIPETPTPDTELVSGVTTTLLANNETALAAAAVASRRAGFVTLELPGALLGAAREAGRKFAALGGALASDRVVVAIAGGETTVRVRGDGVGGRNQELALAAAIELSGSDAASLLAVGTDGIDGPTDAAGAFADGGTKARGRLLGLEASAALDANDSNSFFAREGGIVRTGPTGTNVMDLAFLHVEPAAR
jgi:glycerate 2-kinase